MQDSNPRKTSIYGTFFIQRYLIVKVGTHPLPQEEKIGVSLVNYIHADIKVEFVLREFVSGRIKTLVQIEQLCLDAFIAIYHNMWSNAIGVVIGSPNLNL